MRWLLGLLLMVGISWAEVVVIASDGKDLSADVSSSASRCDYYIVMDENGNMLKSMGNPHHDVRGGASSHLVALLQSEQASHFIAAEMGMKLEEALIARKISYSLFDGSVKEAVADYRSDH